MRSESKMLSKEKKPVHAIWIFNLWMVGFVLVISFLLLSQVKATPAIIDEEDCGYWEDNFEDSSGIETQDNLKLEEGDIELIKMTSFSEYFTGNDGDLPNSTKWNTVNEGYTLEIKNNRLKTSASPPPATWVNVTAWTNDSFGMNHKLTWRQLLHTVDSGMFVHFFVLNGINNSRLLCVSQDYGGNYGIYNYITTTPTNIGWWVSGWHDFKVIFDDGLIEFYLDDVKKWDYDFNVTCVKYRFGTAVRDTSSTIETDDIVITNYAMTGNFTSTKITLPDGKIFRSLLLIKTECIFENHIRVTILDSETYRPIPGFENLTGADIDMSAIDMGTYPSIRLKVHFLSNGGASPVLHRLKVTWIDSKSTTTPTTAPPAKLTGWIVPYAATIAVAILGVYFIGATEAGKYKFLLFFLPLYTRLKKKEVLNQLTRESIYEHVRKNPGDHYNSIKQELDLNNGVLAYHLRTLERENYIISIREGVYKRFYPLGSKIPKPPKMQLNPIRIRIIETIKRNPGIIQKEIFKSLNLSQQIVSYHVNLMIESGLIRAERHGNTFRYFVNNLYPTPTM